MSKKLLLQKQTLKLIAKNAAKKAVKKKESDISEIVSKTMKNKREDD